MRDRLQDKNPLRSVRQARDLSLADVAASAGITESHLSRIEAGHRLPSLPVLLRLARVLGFKKLTRLLEPYVPREEVTHDKRPAKGHRPRPTSKQRMTP